MSSELSATARDVMEAADVAYVAPISFYEITQKHRLGKWPELDPVIGELLPLWSAQGTEIAPCTAEIAFLAGAMQWSHRDPFDRMIAATAIAFTTSNSSRLTKSRPPIHSRARSRAPACASVTRRWWTA